VQGCPRVSAANKDRNPWGFLKTIQPEGKDGKQVSRQHDRGEVTSMRKALAVGRGKET